ncbi:SDR family NAD(P)-dependent oxidoreductase [Methylomagnum sp.]
MSKQDEMPNVCQDISSRPAGITRRDFLRVPTAVAATSIALPSMLGSVFMAETAKAANGGAILDPRYYPLENFEPEIDLHGKLAVITGASRGIGRAAAEALAARGAEVIGTSRNVKTVPNPPAYPLLDLDITKPKSVDKFIKALNRRLNRRKKVDILINNAGRFVIGPVAPATLDSSSFYFEQLQLATETLYLGHIRVTNALLPLMPAQGYARVLFTVSSAAYLVSGTDPLLPWIQQYVSAKRALLAYANSLRFALREASSNIVISTVNPYIIGTTGADHPHPIYTQPVSDTGFTDDPPSAPFNQILSLIRQIQSTGLPPSFAGNAYAQLLASSEPSANVVVGSTQEPYATQGGTAFLESLLLAENAESAIRYSCG